MKRVVAPGLLPNSPTFWPCINKPDALAQFVMWVPWALVLSLKTGELKGTMLVQELTSHLLREVKVDRDA